MIGTETIDGTRTRVVTFFVEVTGSRSWYRLWIDDDRLVRKPEMRTQGHFMDHTYYDFNADIEIEPPARGSP